MKNDRITLVDIARLCDRLNNLSVEALTNDPSKRRLSTCRYDARLSVAYDSSVDLSRDTIDEEQVVVTGTDMSSAPLKDVLCALHRGRMDENSMLETIKQLEQQKGSPVDFRKDFTEVKRDCSLMHSAARLGFVTVMQYLVDKQPDIIEATDKSGATPIFYAAAAAQNEAVTLLALLGANLNVHDSYEASPLSVSLNSKNKENGFQVAKTLMQFRVDVEFKIYGSNTILHMACKEGDLDKVQFIVSDLKHNIFRKDTRQESVLFRAVKHEKVCKYLLDYCHKEIGHDRLLKLVSMTNDQKRTVIHHCCSKGYKLSLIHIIAALQNDKAKLEQLFNEKDGTFGLTPLHITILANQEDVFSMLIRASEVKLDVQNNKGDTPLHIAIRQQKMNMIKELYHLYLDNSKSLSLKNDQRKTIQQMAKDYDVDLAKLEKDLESDNAGIEKESFWNTLFQKKKPKKKITRKEASKKLESAKKSQLTDMSWDASQYALGHDLVDDQHTVLIGLLHDLSNYAMTSQSHWVVGYVIGCCAEYTETHFKDEQEMFSKYKKGLGQQYTKHMEEHEMFTQKIKQIHKDYLKNHSTSLDIELLHYLVDWLVKHINYTDRKMVEFINTHEPDEV